MTNPTPEQGLVGGIDSHTDTIHVALISPVGQDVADHEFPTTASGYRAAVAWLGGHGQVAAVGVEGTSSYGRGITTALHSAGISVVEVNRTRAAEAAATARATVSTPTAPPAACSPARRPPRLRTVRSSRCGR